MDDERISELWEQGKIELKGVFNNVFHFKVKTYYKDEREIRIDKTGDYYCLCPYANTCRKPCFYLKAIKKKMKLKKGGKLHRGDDADS